MQTGPGSVRRNAATIPPVVLRPVPPVDSSRARAKTRPSKTRGPGTGTDARARGGRVHVHRETDRRPRLARVSECDERPGPTSSRPPASLYVLTPRASRIRTRGQLGHNRVHNRNHTHAHPPALRHRHRFSARTRTGGPLVRCAFRAASEERRRRAVDGGGPSAKRAPLVRRNARIQMYLGEPVWRVSGG